MEGVEAEKKSLLAHRWRLIKILDQNNPTGRRGGGGGGGRGWDGDRDDGWDRGGGSWERNSRNRDRDRW